MQLGFSIYDLLTRITPGAVFISPFFVAPDLSSHLSFNSLTSASALTFILLSLIFGEAIALSRETLKPVPDTFRRFLYHETGRADFLGRFDKWRLELGVGVPKRRSIYISSDRELYYEIIDEFGMHNDNDYVRDLFNLTVNYLDSGMSTRTNRLKTTYLFAENLSLALLGFTLIASVRFTVGGPEEKIMALVLTVIALIAMLALFIAFDLYGRVEYRYVDSLVSEFFVAQHKEE